MSKIKEILSGFFLSNAFKRFVWIVIDAFIGSLIVYLGELNWVWLPVIIGTLEQITKYINTNYLQKSETAAKYL